MKLKALSKKDSISEEKVVEDLLAEASFLKKKSTKIFKRAKRYVKNIREQSDELNIESFLKEYSLNSYEGVAILCLAESLLRVPDKQTADELILDKLGKGNWQKHLDTEAGFLLNSSTYGLMLGEEILTLDNSKSLLSKSIGKVIKRISEPVIRNAIKHAMKILGSKFVLGTDINSALKNAQEIGKSGYLFSFDMLGEGARTGLQATTFYNSYMNATKNIGKLNNNNANRIYDNPNISIKLSALHPRYELKKKSRVISELIPKLKDIISEAKKRGLWVSIDAEESYRLELSLIIFEEVLKDKEFKGWGGLGFVVQAYNKRAKYVLEHIKYLSEKYKTKIPVRLVKGAYWDAEIKHAQIEGLDGYPVFTRKSHTDLSYLICAKFMLDNLDNFYPQFATHNALTVASILETAPKGDGHFEFQRLYGMGDSFYDQIVNKIPCRIYAPVGSYDELLPYLIRRILENGANSSFVNLVVDKKEPIGEILTDPVEKIINKAYTSKLVILPKDLYGNRENSKGYNLGNIIQIEHFKNILKTDISKNITANSIINGKEVTAKSTDIKEAITIAKNGFKKWKNEDPKKRVKCALSLAGLIESNFDDIVSILAYEAKKTVKDSIFEIREAVDFLRFYALEAENILNPDRGKQLGYTGEASVLNYRAKGVFACISPWNFPLSIFIGQIAAAMVVGNSVIAKPAEQTSKIAYFIIKLAHQAGIPKDVLQLIIGKGSTIGKYITASPDIAGVVFTGSTEVANIINQNLAARKSSSIATFIAETGGQNCFIIDSTALLERACDDLIESSFGSAGQKCSATRVAYIQEDIYDNFVELLEGAISEIKIDKANNYDCDISEVIDSTAKQDLEKHITATKKKFNSIGEIKINKKLNSEGNFVTPHIFEIDNISTLKKENFGPILHLIKFKRTDIDKIIEEINSTGYGLTFAIHSRIYNFIEYVTNLINAGNIYVNRTSTGAVVETHPFGGMGLSGTGPKAGGPNYLKRFLHEVTITDNTSAIGGNLELLT